MTKLPFNLEAAKKGAKLVTRGGREAVFVAYDEGAKEGYRLLVRFGSDACAHFMSDDGFGIAYSGLSPDDLFILAETRNLSGHEYPAPMTEAPKFGSVYFVIKPASVFMEEHFAWNGDKYDYSYLKRGLCHSTKEAAIAHARAVILAGGGEV